MPEAVKDVNFAAVGLARRQQASSLSSFLLSSLFFFFFFYQGWGWVGQGKGAIKARLQEEGYKVNTKGKGWATRVTGHKVIIIGHNNGTQLPHTHTAVCGGSGSELN